MNDKTDALCEEVLGEIAAEHMAERKSSDSPDGYVAAPRRRVELTIKIGADSWREAAGALADLEHRILADGPITSLVSGGWSAGYSVTGSEDTEQTGDKYRKENAEYVGNLKAT